MQTIEERAKEYAPDPFDPDYILPAREEYIVKQQRQAYIAGAKEQKEIDKNDKEEGEALLYTANKVAERTKKEMIDKACEWFDNYLMEIGYPDDWLRDSLNIKSGKERFRKAMEE